MPNPKYGVQKCGSSREVYVQGEELSLTVIYSLWHKEGKRTVIMGQGEMVIKGPRSEHTDFSSTIGAFLCVHLRWSSLVAHLSASQIFIQAHGPQRCSPSLICNITTAQGLSPKIPSAWAPWMQPGCCFADLRQV